MTSPGHRCSEEQQDILARMLNIFDTQPAEELPRLTRITRTFFQVKSVVISLVNNERQWFLSKANFPRQEPDIEFSFCVQYGERQCAAGHPRHPVGRALRGQPDGHWQ